MFFLLCVFLCVGSARARRTWFYQGHCGSPTCYVSVDNPGVLQTYYETLREGNVIVYELSGSLEDNSLSVSAFTPIEQGAKICSGVQVTVRVNKQPKKTWVFPPQQSTTTLDPFYQVATRVNGDVYLNDEPWDAKDVITVHVSGPTHDFRCRLGISIGTATHLSVTTLLNYPLDTIWAWRWGWKGDTYRMVFGFMSFVGFAGSGLLWILRRSDGWCTHLAYAGFSCYLVVFLIRVAFMLQAVATAKDYDPVRAGWAALIILSDVVFVLAIGVYSLGAWFKTIADSLTCCTSVCCCLRCVYTCLEGEQDRAAVALVVGVSVLSLFAFSPGFYLGPSFLLLSGVAGLRAANAEDTVAIY